MTRGEYNVVGIAVYYGTVWGSNPGGCKSFSPSLQSRLAVRYVQHLVTMGTRYLLGKGSGHVIDHALLCSAKVKEE